MSESFFTAEPQRRYAATEGKRSTHRRGTEYAEIYIFLYSPSAPSRLPGGGQAAPPRCNVRILLHRRDTERQSRNQRSKLYFTTETQSTQRSEYFLIKNPLLRVLRASAVNVPDSFHRRDTGHEKKSKNHQNCKFHLNEIKYLQRLIFAKRDFFSRPQSSQRVTFLSAPSAPPRCNKVSNVNRGSCSSILPV